MSREQVTLGIKNKCKVLEKGFYVPLMNGKEGLSYQVANKSVGHEHARTVHGVFSSCLVGEIMMFSSRNTVKSIIVHIKEEEVAT